MGPQRNDLYSFNGSKWVVIGGRPRKMLKNWTKDDCDKSQYPTEENNTKKKNNRKSRQGKSWQIYGA